MSVEKQQLEARRWLATAVDDLEAARLLADGGKHAHACFAAQQAGEKAIKALWCFRGADPWGHSVQRLLRDLEPPEVRSELADLLEDGAMLDRHYIPTRYPNGLPDLTPGEVYFRRDADACMDAAGRIIDRARGLIG
jgi:HEPN domain-containing protein